MKIINVEKFSDWNGAIGSCSFCGTEVVLENEDVPVEKLHPFQLLEFSDGNVLERNVFENKEIWEKEISINPMTPKSVSNSISQIWVINRWKILCPKCSRKMVVGTSYPTIGVSRITKEFPTSVGVKVFGEYKIFKWKSVFDTNDLFE